MAPPLYEDGDLLTVVVAAAIAGRSIRTIRRAYLEGTLVAYRDARGRGVRIRYGDLRGWMMSELVDRSSSKSGDVGENAWAVGVPSSHRRVVSSSRASVKSENLALLDLARQQRTRRVRGAVRGRNTAGRSG